MGWSLLAQQFALELAFGVLVALAFVPPAPVGRFFYRLMGTCAALPTGAALVIRLRAGAGASDPAVLGAAVALAAFPLTLDAAPRRRWTIGMTLALLGAGVGTGWVVRQGLPELSWPGHVVGAVSSLATGAVAGGVGLAMVLGHWYLTVPRMEIQHLVRLNRVTIAAMGLSLASLAAACVSFAEALRLAEPPLFGP